MNHYQIGQKVHVAPRERPFHDDPEWVWTVTFYSEDWGLNLEHDGIVRLGVSPLHVRPVLS